VPGAFDPRDIGNQEGLQLTGIQMTPAPPAFVLARAGFATLRTSQLTAATLNNNHDFILRQRNLHIGHASRLFDTQYLAV